MSASRTVSGRAVFPHLEIAVQRPDWLAGDPVYIYTLLRLPWLAPDITMAIVNGRQPPQLNAKKLMRLTAHLPAGWTEQRALLGFVENKSSVR